MSFIEPTLEQFQQLSAAAAAGGAGDEAVIMVNLLRFKQHADGIDAADGITGAEAYARYSAAVLPHLNRAGGRVLLALAVQQSVIGPPEREWDMVLAVRYPSHQAFLKMTSDPKYLEIHWHRAAALADSRLIACTLLSDEG